MGTGFPLLQHGRPVAWVKYTDSSSCLERETETQAYVYETLNQQPALLEFVRVPGVLRLIEIDDRPYVLVVMEYVHGGTVRQCLKNEDTEERKHRFWAKFYALSTPCSASNHPQTGLLGLLAAVELNI